MKEDLSKPKIVKIEIQAGAMSIPYIFAIDKGG